MPEVIFAGPAGRLEGRFHHAKQRGAPDRDRVCIRTRSSAGR